MAIYTFSTKEKKPDDTEMVERLKKYCYMNNLNFSAVVIEQLKKLEKELTHDRRPKA